MSSRQGASEAEAALIWAAATFGASDGLFASLEAPSREATRAGWRRLVSSTTDNEQALREWESLDRQREAPAHLLQNLDLARQTFHLSQLSPRWLSLSRAIMSEVEQDPVIAKIATAEILLARRPAREDLTLDPELGFDTAQLWSWSPADIKLLARRFGAMQLAESWRRIDRRQLARLLRAMTDATLRGWVMQDLKTPREIERVEETRLREVISKLSRRFPEQGEMVLHLGLFSLAMAAGRRHRQRVEVLSRSLPTPLANALRGYAAQTRRSSRQGLEIATSSALHALLERWQPEHR